MRILSPPTAEEPKDSLFCRSLHQECFTTLLQSTASSLFLRIAGCHPTIPILERFQQSRCKGPLLSALPLRTQRLCVILFRSSLLNFELSIEDPERLRTVNFPPPLSRYFITSLL